MNPLSTFVATLRHWNASRRPDFPEAHMRRSFVAAAIGLLLAGTLLTACDSGSEPEVEIEDIVVGDGTVAADRDIVIIDYVGMLTDGTVFDTSENWGPLRFQLQTGVIYSLPEGQSGRVIQGLIEGVPGMKVGGVRLLTIPPEMAYGRSGVSGVIPPNATLLFEIELLGVLTSGD